MGCAKKIAWKSQTKKWVKIPRYRLKREVRLIFYSIQFVRQSQFLSPVSESKKSSLLFHFDAFDWKKCISSRCFIQNWEKFSHWKKSWNSPGKVLEFCFPISVWTLYVDSNLFMHGWKFSGLFLDLGFWGWLSTESHPQNAEFRRLY